MHIKQAEPIDIPIIQQLAQTIWPPTFSNILSRQQIEYMLQWMYSNDSLCNQMQDGCIFFIAYDEDLPIGFASWQKISYNEAKLHKLYVLPEMQGKKVGFALLQKTIALSQENSLQRLILNVNRYNQKAIDFYLRTGFKIEKEEDIDIGQGYFMNDYVMAKQLIS